MEHSSAFCSAGWLWGLQSLCLERGTQGRTGWYCKASTLRQVSKVSRKPVCDLLLPDFPWLFHLALMAAGINIFCGCSEDLARSWRSWCTSSEGDRSTRHWWDLLSLVGNCHTVTQGQIVGVYIQPGRDSAAALIGRVHKMQRVYPSGKYRYSLQQPLKNRLIHLWIPHWMVLSPCLSQQDN